MLNTVKALKEITEKLEQHPMCFNYEFTGSRVTVFYPDGDFPTHGVTCGMHDSKTKNMAVVLERMERDWQGSYPNGGGTNV